MKTLLPLLILLAVASGASAQDLLAQARAQYAEAAYEEALATLARAEQNAPNQVAVHQYRAFCLVALGRTADAERALTTLVRTDPTFVPSSEEIAPRVLAMFGDIRRRMLPTVARSVFAEARAAYQDKALDRATKQFELVMTLVNDPAVKNTSELEDLRVLTAGFLDLTKASAKPAPAEAEASAPTAALVVPPVIEPPVAIDQKLPEWNPPAITLAATRDFSGAVTVIIGADGRVKSAAMTRPVYPLYDALVLEAAKSWTYRPALKNGEPVESEKVIEIRLRGR